MKIKYLLSFSLLLTIFACSDDFLQPESISTFDLDYVYSNIDDARKGVNAVYASFQQDAFRSRLSNNMTGNTDIEHASGWTSNGDRYQIWDLTAVPANRDLDIVWTYAYESIRNANIAIEGITASGKLDSSDDNERADFYQLMGEAYTLRAYWYSMLIYYFGDVPYVRDAPKAGDEFNLPRTDRNEILSGVIQDLIDIEDKMKWADQAQYGIEQVNREYAIGMIARLSLQRGGYYLKPDLTMDRPGDYLEYYQIAKDYAAKLMNLKDRPLPSDYRQVFLNQSKFISPTNADVLFEVPFSLNQGDVGWNIGITVDGGSTASHDYGSGNNYMSMPPTYYLSFDTLDVRRDVTCALYKINTDFEEVFIEPPTNIAQGKWSRHFLENPPGATSAKSTGINWPMMRYADVILMFAEAENELNGPTSAAQGALARVRQRAFESQYWTEKVDQYVANVSASKQTFFEAIVNERAWEFGGEMIRKYELIRWGIYSDVVKETVDDLKELTLAAYNGTTNYPIYMYWKRDENGRFVIYNPNRRVVAPPDDTWNQAPFLLSMYDEAMTYDEWITRDWENYYDGEWKANVVRYIFPTPTIAVENSQGLLTNDGYGFNF